MKILAMTPSFLPVMGGIEVLVDDLASALRGRCIETVVVTDTLGRLPAFEVINGTRVHRFNLARAIRHEKPIAPLSILKEMSDLFEAERPDLIHLHSVTQASAFYLDRLLRKMPNRPSFIITQHGVLEPTDRLGFVRGLLLQADILTAVSDAALNSAISFSGRSGESRRIYNAIPRFNIDLDERSMPPRHVLLCVGRMQLEKGFDLAIEALADVLRTIHDVELWLIGYGEDRATFEALAANLGIAGHVRFLGPLDRESTWKVMAECSALLAPSRTREGFGLVAAEAALAGTPCIASNIGGLPETVEDGVSGYIVRSGDAGALSSAIVKLLGDETMWRRMSVDAQRRAVDKFDFKRCVDSYSTIYNKLLSARRDS